jgi:hypothetical protein
MQSVGATCSDKVRNVWKSEVGLPEWKGGSTMKQRMKTSTTGVKASICNYNESSTNTSSGGEATRG